MCVIIHNIVIYSKVFDTECHARKMGGYNILVIQDSSAASRNKPSDTTFVVQDIFVIWETLSVRVASSI